MNNILKKHCIRVSENISAAIQRLDGLNHDVRQLAVIDDKNIYRGEITDCHIRLSIFNGLDYSNCIGDLLLVADKAEIDVGPKSNLERTSRSPFSRKLVVEKNKLGQIENITFERLSQRSSFFNAIIMAGGFGRRLGKLTNDIPKPLLQIQNRPILSYVIDQVIESKPSAIYLSIYHLAQQFRQFSKTDACVAKINFIQESRPLGTAGAIGLIEQPLDYNLLVLNADILSDLKLSNLCDYHACLENDVTIGVKTHHSVVPFGVVNCDFDGHVLSIVEKPETKHYVAAGIYALSPAAQKLVEKDEKIDMPDLILRAQKKRLRVTAFPIFEYWADLGNPEELNRAAKRLESRLGAEKQSSL